MNTYIFFWLVVAVFFLLFELGTPGLFYFLSFSCGALIAFVAGAFCMSVVDQASIFLISSVAAFFLLKEWVKRYGSKSHYHSNIYAMQGKRGVIITPATMQQFGYVHIGGETWACKTVDNKLIPAGVAVQVMQVRGAHLIVAECENI